MNAAAAAYANRTLGRFVPDEGPLDAAVLVIGDVPWTQEANLGRPFAGEAGKLQDIWWREVGLERSRMRLINLYPYQPARNDVESVPIGELVPWISKLHTRIAEMPSLHIIVTLGNYATFALTGKGQVKAAVRQAFNPGEATVIEKKAGISKLRGSVYRYQDLRGREIIVIPIVHPSAVMGMKKWEKRTVRDWQRVARVLRVGHQQVERRHIVSPDEWQVADFTRMVESNAGDVAMATDIETWGSQLSCVGFALSPTESITIPLIGRSRDIMMPYVKRLCECAVPKILCNGMYDAYWLAWYGIWLANFTWDVQLMHHAIDPSESHSLDFLASIYCEDYRYWKDEGKDGDEVIRYSDELEALWVYNGLDCCYTRELLDCIYADLQQNGLVDFYFRHYQALLDPLIRTSLHGFRVDKKAQKSWAKQLRAELEEIHQQLNAAAGEELFAEEERCELREPTAEEWYQLISCAADEMENPPTARQISKEGRAALMEQGLTYMIGGQNAGKIRYKVKTAKKDFSKDKLMRFFYETLGLPKQFKLTKGVGGKKRTISLDEGSIRKMTAKWSDKISNWGNLLLAYREKKKELDYLKGSYDGDGRIRCSYKMLTEAGRLSSSTNPRRTGYNLQNIKR